jgi:hypothetical protein
MLMLRGKKSDIRNQLELLKDSLIDEHEAELRIYGSYQDVAYKVRVFAEYLRSYYAVSKHHNLFKRVMKGCNWAAHAKNDRSWPHTDVTNAHQQQMVDDLWEMVEEWDAVKAGREESDSDEAESSEEEEDSDADKLAGMLSKLSVAAVPRCRFWARGYCRYGDGCRFAHC